MLLLFFFSLFFFSLSLSRSPPFFFFFLGGGFREGANYPFTFSLTLLFPFFLSLEIDTDAILLLHEM